MFGFTTEKHAFLRARRVAPHFGVEAFSAKAIPPRGGQMLGFTGENHTCLRAKKVARHFGLEAF